MRIKKRWIVLGGCLVALAGAHQWVLSQLGETLIGALREESGYPVRLGSMRGFLPAGRVNARDLQFKLRLDETDSVDFDISGVRLNVALLAMRDKHLIAQSFEAPRIDWIAHLRSMKGDAEGSLSLEGSTMGPVPEGLPEETVYLERLEISSSKIEGNLNNKEIRGLHGIDVSLAPLAVCDDVTVLPLHFDFSAALSEGPDGPRLVADGVQDQEKGRIEANLGAVAIDLPTLNTLLDTGSIVDPELGEIRELVGEWILDGSYTVRLSATVARKVLGSVVEKGSLTLRLSKPKFGEALKGEKIADQEIRGFLNAFEEREDTIQIGPVEFEELPLGDLEDPAWDKIEADLVAHLVLQAPEAALQTGVGMLKDFFSGKSPSNRDRPPGFD